MKIDLHSHTTASDGRLSPTELVSRAALQGVSVLAITDHDSLTGLPEAEAVAKDKGIKLISGVEISTKWHNFEIHIVGLGVSQNNSTLNHLLESQSSYRILRAQQIAEKLSKRGIEGTYESACAYANGGSVGRGHFARVLLERNLVRTQQQAFDKYLGRGQSAYVASQWCTIEQSVTAIQAAGGVAVLAHPKKYRLSNKWLRKLIVEFVEFNGDAIEALHCQQAPDEREFLCALAKAHNLMISAGSDFHFPNRWIELGRGLQRPEQKGVWHHFGWIPEHV